MSFIDPRDGKRKEWKVRDDSADRPAPSGEANLRHTPNCNSVLFNGPMAECDCGLIAPAPQMVEDFDRAERVFKSVGSGENVYEAFAAEFAIIRAAERNRARREALELADATESLLNTMLSVRTFAQRERVDQGDRGHSRPRRRHTIDGINRLLMKLD